GARATAPREVRSWLCRASKMACHLYPCDKPHRAAAWLPVATPRCRELTLGDTMTRASSKRVAPAQSAADPGFVQLLTPAGQRVSHPEYSVDFTDDELRGLYRDLVTVRKLDAEATALQRQGELGIWASLLGQEAAQVGSGRALREQDMAFPTYREHGVLYCRGIDPIMPLSLFRGVGQGAWNPEETTFRLYAM